MISSDKTVIDSSNSKSIINMHCGKDDCQNNIGTSFDGKKCKWGNNPFNSWDTLPKGTSANSATDKPFIKEFDEV